MKIGISQIRQKAPDWIRMIRNGFAILVPSTITFLHTTKIITDPVTLLTISETCGYVITLLVVACIFSGVDPERLKPEVNGEENNGTN